MTMRGMNLGAVKVNLSLRQEEGVVLASLRKHCNNIERELMNHALGADSMSQTEVSDSLTFLESAMVVMRHYGD